MSWLVDETCLKVCGRWCYLYRAIDRYAHLIDALLSKHRDMKAAQAFFRSLSRCQLWALMGGKVQNRSTMLTDLFITRGTPAYIRSDNGPEFIATAVKTWITELGAKPA